MGVRGGWAGGLAAGVLALTTARAGCGVGDRGPARVVLNRAEGSFGSYGRAAGQLFEPNGIGVDQRTGDVFVVDSNNARIDRFTSSGLFLFAWGWGIPDKHKSLASSLVAERCSHRCFLGLEGPGAGQFQFPEGVAVDNSPTSPSRGELWVVDIGDHRIEKFSPDGRFLLEIGNGVNDVTHQQGYPSVENRCPVNAGDICGPGSEDPSKGPGELEFPVEGDFIAVGPSGTLYVGQRNSVMEFTPRGHYKTVVKLTPSPRREIGREAGGVSALAVNDTGDIYVVRHGVTGVREYSPSGKAMQTLEPGLGPADPEAQPPRSRPTPTMTCLSTCTSKPSTASTSTVQTVPRSRASTKTSQTDSTASPTASPPTSSTSSTLAPAVTSIKHVSVQPYPHTKHHAR
jgi:hypothetical protein